MISKIFCPNGMTSSQIIVRLAKKEFGNDINGCDSYVELKNQIIKSLRKKTAKQIEENRLDTLVGIKHLEENDFSNFISVRFAYWGMLITIAAMVIGDVPIYEYFDMTKGQFGKTAGVCLCIFLIIMARVIHYQHDQLEYLNFKLICFEEMQQKNRR